MNNFYIPGSCVKCENELKLEKYDDMSGAMYCGHCDFVLPLTKEEVEKISILVE